jgi:hypothetical protein
MVRRAAIALAGLALLAGGCGGGGSSSNGEASADPQTVVDDAQAAALGAKGVHVSGTIVDSGQKLTIDLDLVKDKGGRGTFSEQGLTFQVVRVGDTLYIKGSDAFYRKFAGEVAAQLLHDRWLSGPATTGRLASITPLTDLAKLFKGALSSHGKLTNKGETAYKGQRAVEIFDHSADGGTLFVAATGKPYPLAIQSPQAGKNGTIAFDEWNQTVTISAPKDAVDVSKLGK